MLIQSNKTKIGDIFGSILIALVVVLFTTMSSWASEMPRGRGRVIVFEFKTKAGESSSSEYLNIIKSVVMKTFYSTIDRDRYISEAIFISQDDLHDMTPEVFAENERINNFISGEIQSVGRNAIISATWTNKNIPIEGQEKVFLGVKDLEDFELVVRKVEELALQVKTAMLEGAYSKEQRPIKILVACFSGADDALNRYTTLELPHFLFSSLMKRGFNPIRIKIEGLDFRDYSTECLKYQVRENMYGFSYILSGTMIIQENKILLRPILIDQQRRMNVPIRTNLVFYEGDFTRLPEVLAERLVNPLIVLMIQGLLLDEGLDPGVVDGHMGPKTKEALQIFQKRRDLPATGSLDKQTMEYFGLLKLK